MTIGGSYKVTKKIKIHTKPDVVANVVQTGIFLRETEKYYIFDDFRVKKSVVVKIQKQVWLDEV